jgi:transcriptional regulator with XRE-family HTH domain
VGVELDPETQAVSEQIGIKIKKARLKAKLSQATLAERLGMSRGSYVRIEKGKTNVTIESLRRIADGLDLELQVSFRAKK